MIVEPFDVLHLCLPRVDGVGFDLQRSLGLEQFGFEPIQVECGWPYLDLLDIPCRGLEPSKGAVVPPDSLSLVSWPRLVLELSDWQSRTFPGWASSLAEPR